MYLYIIIRIAIMLVQLHSMYLYTIIRIAIMLVQLHSMYMYIIRIAIMLYSTAS